MGTELILAIDQGTTGTTAACYTTDNLTPTGSATVEFPQHFPEPGRVEHDPREIWKSVAEAVGKATAGINTKRIAAIGITNQRETVLAWSRKTGETFGNAIVWQDRRTAGRCEAIKKDETAHRLIREKTGLVCDPYFSASKIEWMISNREDLAKRKESDELIFGTVDSFMLSRLTGGVCEATDHTNASRTMLYDIRTGTFDGDLCRIFGVKKSQLPAVQPSSHLFGTTKGLSFLPDGIPVTGCLGDQQAALFGHGFSGPGQGKVTYGTGAFILVSTGNAPAVPPEGILSTVAYSAGETRTFALEGSAFIAGAAVQFMRDNFGWIKSAAESERLAGQEPRDPNLFFIPALSGLAAPYWNPAARGVLFGLTRGTSKSQICRAVLESIAFQNVEILRIMKNAAGVPLSRLGADGGASMNGLLMQFQADCGQVELVRPARVEVTALGAARAALIGLDPKSHPAVDEERTVFGPRVSPDDADHMVERWSRAARCVNEFYR